MDRYAFEQAIKAHLQTADRSQAAIARRLGYSADTFNKWVRGVNRMPDDAIARFGQLLELSAGEITRLFTLAGYTVPGATALPHRNGQAAEALPGRRELAAYLEAQRHLFARWADLPADHTTPLFAQGEDPEAAPDLYLDLKAQALPMRVAEFRPQGSNGESKVEDLLSALGRAERNIILGAPGSGKTSSLERIAWLMADQSLAVVTGQAPIPQPTPLTVPIFVRLADYQDEADLLPLLRRSLNRTGALTLDNDNLRTYLRTPDLRFLLLLDGLNEFDRDVQERGVKAVRLHLDDYPSHAIYLTCRVADFDYQWYHRHGFRLWEIQPLIDQIERWQDSEQVSDLRTYLRRHLGETAGQRLYYRLRNDERLYSLARLPLFLWMFKETSGADGALPHDRGHLLQQFVRARRLLGSVPKSLRTQAERTLEALSWAMQQRGGLEIDDQALYTVLASVRGLQSYDLDAMRAYLQGAGLLVDLENGRYRLLHQLVQEYGAAAYLARQPDGDEQILALSEQEWWRECLILALWLRPDLHRPAYLQQLMTKDKADFRVRVEAGLILAQIGDPRFPIQTVQFLDDKGKTANVKRVQVITPTLVPIPAGEAILGGEDPEAFDTEYPACTVPVNAFYMAIYPVTNAEYRCFLEAGGYQDERWWLPDGWAWRQGAGRLSAADEEIFHKNYQLFHGNAEKVMAAWRAKGEYITEAQADIYRYFAGLAKAAFMVERTREFLVQRQAPAFWQHSDFNQANQPVVGINWYEAMAYTTWLAYVTQHPYRLPSEAEWEWAARRQAYTGGRCYPWGNQWDMRRCNNGALQFGRTCAVGLFPQGATPDGIYDLAGNVYQWTATLFRSYPYHPADGREDPAGEGPRQPRWLLGVGSAHNRCSTRSYSLPLFQNERTGFRLVQDVID
ncbi:MAG: SUMF1/EgtB/PvdO family nonheme iron enzyme [Caldilineaceae bacterium]